MAEASVVVTVTDMMPLAGRGVLVHGTLAIDASSDTYATGGLALGVTEFGAKVLSHLKPLFLVAFGIAGYDYKWDRANSKLFVRQSAASATVLGEITGGGAIPSGVSGDTISFIALFNKPS